MKKFLTVLLALSVVFTYTVGTAFAAVPADKDKVAYQTVLDDVNAAANTAKAQELKAMNDGIYNIFGTKSSITATIDSKNITLDKSSVEAAYKVVYDEKIAAIDVLLNARLEAVRSAVVDDNASGVAFSGYFDGTDPAPGTAEDGYPLVQAGWTQMGGNVTTPANFTATTYDMIAVTGGEWTVAAGQHEVLDKALETQFTADKAAALTAIDTVEKTLATTYSADAKGANESPLDQAKALVSKALSQINTTLPVNNTTTADAISFATALDKIAQIYVAPVNQAGATGALFEGTTVDGISYAPGLDHIAKLSSEPTEAAKLAWAKEKVLNDVSKQINDAKATYVNGQNDTIVGETLKDKPNQDTINTAKENIATANTQYAAALEILNYLVADCDDYKVLVSNVDPFTTSTTVAVNWNFAGGNLTVPAKDFTSNFAAVSNGTGTKVSAYTLATSAAISKAVADLKTDADLAKKTMELDGTTYAEIEAKLANAVSEAYYGNKAAALETVSASEILASRKAELIGKTDSDTVKVNSKTYDAVEAWDKALTSTYEKDQYDAVRKVMSDAKTSIKAATTVAAADAAFLAGLDALDAVPTTADKTLAQAKKDFIDLKAKYDKDIEAYATYKHNSHSTDVYDHDKAEFVKNLKATFVDAYTTDELTKLYNDAVAEIDNLKTEAQLKEAKTALEARIKALPTAPTVADKAVVDALDADINAHNDYCKLIGNVTENVVVTATLESAKTAIKNAEIKAIKDAYDAINKDGKATLDEKDAVKALRAALDAYLAAYTPENATPSEIAAVEATTISDAAVSALEKDINEAEVKVVKEMIAVLDSNKPDAAAVKAARAAYDALDPDYQFGGTYYDKLVALEKVLGQNLSDLALKATSAKVKGGIRVYLNGASGLDLDNAYIQVWKSKNAVKWTFTKRYALDTKSVKITKTYKGKNYFRFRVVTVNADGTKTYSAWSKYACRIIK